MIVETELDQAIKKFNIEFKWRHFKKRICNKCHKEFKGTAMWSWGYGVVRSGFDLGINYKFLDALNVSQI